MPDAILDQLTQLELQNLTALASHSVYKAQELADAAEAVALQRCGPTFLASGAVPRHWVQQVVYVSFATGGIVLALGGRWVRRIGGPATQAAIDAAGGVWFRDPATGVWVASATGRTSIAVPGQAVLAVPAGETFTDPDGQRVLVPTVLWVDQTTGDTSLTGPEGGDQWAGGSNAAGRALPDGLGPLIQAPQEYVVARLLLTAGGLTAAEVAAWTAAVQSFQAPGPWEDVRQPLYALTPGGQLLVDASGLPVPNPLRTVVTPFRGEINDYYRSLVRDHGIDPFVSRTAEQFELIQVASLLALDQSVLDRFAGVQNDCVRVFRAAFYDAAYEGDPLYFRYCRLFIAWMAVMRMVDEAMTGFGDIDRMGNYDVTNLLYSFGMYTFDDMPLVYKRRFAKGMETIISNKGTTAVFKDILDIFNLGTDVTIWQHYLVRYFPSSSSHVRLPRAAAAGEVLRVSLSGGGTASAPVTVAGTAAALAALAAQLRAMPGCREAGADADGLGLWIFPVRDSGAAISELEIVEPGGGVLAGTAGAPTTDYGLPEVGFLKAALGTPLAKVYAANADMRLIEDYDAATAADQTWLTTRDEARALAFSSLRTKYFSVTAALDTVRNGMVVSLLWGTLKDAQVRGRAGGLETHGGPVSMTAMEALVAMLTLTLWKFGVADLIPHGESGVSTIVGARTDGAPYPGESSLLPYSTHLARVAELPDPLTDDGIVSIVETDLAVSDRLQATLAVANRTAGPADPLLGGEESTAYAQYRAIERLYEYKFITKYQAAAFGSADTYSDWLDQSNPALGVWVRAQDAAGTADDAILAIAAIMEDAIRAKTFNFATAFGVTDIILQYVKRLILFFKAYTTDLKSFSVFMLVDAPAFETVRLMNVLAGVRASFLRADGSPMADSQRILSSWGRAGRLRLDAGLAHMVAWSLATEALEGGDWGAAAAQGLAVDAALLGDRAGPTATAAAGADWVRAGDQLADLAYLLRPSEAIAAGDSCSLASPLAPEDAVAPEDRVAGVAAALLGETGLEPQDLTAALASLTRAEHAIVTGSAQTLTRALAASPAAGLSDRLVITSASVRHDTACARTQGLGPAGTGGRGLDDAAAIL